MKTVSYHDGWGEEQAYEEQPQREIHSDTEVLTKLCNMMDDDPLAFFVWTQRYLYPQRTYQDIANRLGSMNPKNVTRMAIYDRIKKMLAKAKNLESSDKYMVMPKAARKIKVKAELTSFDKERSKYKREKQK